MFRNLWRVKNLLGVIISSKENSQKFKFLLKQFIGGRDMIGSMDRIVLETVLYESVLVSARASEWTFLYAEVERL